jgi:ABC-2 type transport system ATP-binding protein
MDTPRSEQGYTPGHDSVRSDVGRVTVGEGERAIDVENLQLTYADGTEAVRGVDMVVPEGEFFGFLGPNGAGKTTTIKILATLLSPTGGRVRVNGFDVRSEPRKIRESIGYMAQETSIDPELTAEENVRFACEAYGVPRSERAQRVSDLLDLVFGAVAVYLLSRASSSDVR